MKSKDSKSATPSDFSSSTTLPRLVRCISGVYLHDHISIATHHITNEY
jgi:hypothetical protein